MIFIIQNIINSLVQKRRLGRRQAFDSGRTKFMHHTHIDDPGIDVSENFYASLRKTIGWTEAIIATIKNVKAIDYAKILRSVNPVYEGRPFYTFDNTYYNAISTADIPFNYDSILSGVLILRPDGSAPIANMNARGKILQFEIDVTTHDGAPCSMNGFVDESDIPPIDTWFYITKKYLYCWIPTLFIGKMQEAMDVEILGSYHWLEESNPVLNNKIIEKMRERQAGGR